MICAQCGERWTEPDCPCSRCDELSRRRQGLAPSLRALAEQVAAIQPPQELADSVLAEFDAVQGARHVRTSRRWMLTVGAAVAASLVAGTLLIQEPPAPKQRARLMPAPAESVSFLPIPYTQPIQPYERVIVVQTFVPVRALIAAGFEVRASDPGGSVQADVMVSQDGRPRAIRPVSFDMSNRRLP